MSTRSLNRTQLSLGKSPKEHSLAPTGNPSHVDIGHTPFSLTNDSIRHFGDAKHAFSGKVTPFSGSSSWFKVQ